jgi:WD40 repeat protein
MTSDGENSPLNFVTLDTSHGVVRILVSDRYIRKTYWLDPQTGEELDERDGSHAIYLPSPDGKYTVMNDPHNNLSVIDDHTQMVYIGHSGYVKFCRWSHDSTRIASVGDIPDAIHIWDPRQPDGTILPQPLLVYKGHSGNIRSLSWSPDDTKIVSGDSDGTAQIWDARSKKLIHKIIF